MVYYVNRRRGHSNTKIWITWGKELARSSPDPFLRAMNFPHFCAEALKHEIETDYVTDIICIRHLIPSAKYPAIQQWPRPIRIHTFNALQISIDDETLLAYGKPKSKSIELLMALISMGSVNVDRTRIADMLCPDAEVIVH